MAVEIKNETEHVVVVEDDLDLSYLIRELLEENGYTTATLDDSADLIEMLENKPAPALLILDLRLPGRSGMDLLPRIKNVWPATKIVVYTGLDEKRHELLDILPYVDRLLKKSISTLHLVQCVKDMVPLKN